MRPRRAWAFAAALVLAAVELVSACSEQVELARLGQACEYDEQCQQGLVCKCVRRRNPDDEGPDEILAPGHCQTASYSCRADAGTSDTAGADTLPSDTAGTETAPDAGDAAAADAADGG
ncbi:MAG: hypothetical protein HYV09_40005 [Deltaproteobacteria bacterium]|nr:hypothetical protein [Deltaproteobacteria bacterium]